MNPIRWKRDHQIAFLGAAVFGAFVGIVVGVRRTDPSASQDLYWLTLGLWAGAGAAAGAAGGFIRQLLRG